VTGKVVCQEGIFNRLARRQINLEKSCLNEKSWLFH
jgi:hypothetical protein